MATERPLPIPSYGSIVDGGDHLEPYLLERPLEFADIVYFNGVRCVVMDPPKAPLTALRQPYWLRIIPAMADKDIGNGEGQPAAILSSDKRLDDTGITALFGGGRHHLNQ